MKVLVTGGAGYIGAVVVRALERSGHVPVVLDSLLTGSRRYVEDQILYEGDIADRDLVRRLVADHPDIGLTVHMAARVSVPESVEQPLDYYADNVGKTLVLLDELLRAALTDVIFSSSASVYGSPVSGFEVTEADELQPQSPYARTKSVTEAVLEDLGRAGTFRSVSLRYFNPFGADPELRVGPYDPRAAHVMGQLLRVARGEQESLRLTGVDLPTRDGSGLRDYVHVWDVARAHVAAVERFETVMERVPDHAVPVNIGTGTGVTVLELVAAFERVTGHVVPVVEAPPRPGDAVGAYANVDRARALLDWEAQASLEEAIASALAWDAKRDEVLGSPVD